MGKLSHAATVGTYYEQMQGGNDLRYELAQIENERAAKWHELSAKRAKSERLEAKQSMAEGQMSEAKKKWAAERKEIMQTFGGQIPSFIVESDRLCKDLANMRNKNEALEASLEVISENLATQLQKLQMEKKNEERIAAQTAEHNVELQRRCRDLQIEKLELETEISKNAEMQRQNPKEYPPESTVIQNLLQAQCEFYFSDY